MQQDKVSELIVKACEDMESRSNYLKIQIRIFIIGGILVAVAGYFGFLGDL